MHYHHVVMLPGSLAVTEVQAALDAAMSRYYYENDEENDGEWDWFVVGGRWPYRWVLRSGGTAGPYVNETSAETGRAHTDCAQLSQLEFESLGSPYSWIRLDGTWETKWLGPDKSGSKDTKDWEVPDEEWEERWMKLLASLPEDTWLVSVDYHN